jgi:hypothetical protein
MNIAISRRCRNWMEDEMRRGSCANDYGSVYYIVVTDPTHSIIVLSCPGMLQREVST